MNKKLFTKNTFGLIADGNRRWAKENNLPVVEGHNKGFEVIRNVILQGLYDHPDWDSLVVYGFSTENWKRSPSEVKSLMKLFSSLENWKQDLVKKEIQFLHAGRIDRLPKQLLKKIESIENETKNFKKFRVVVCLDYGGQDEISRAVEAGGIDFEEYLEAPRLDLILRTGGEHRLSNFCLWQAAYAELNFHTKKLPEIEKEDIEEILEDFVERDRRKGE